MQNSFILFYFRFSSVFASTFFALKAKWKTKSEMKAKKTRAQIASRFAQFACLRFLFIDWFWYFCCLACKLESFSLNNKANEFRLQTTSNRQSENDAKIYSRNCASNKRSSPQKVAPLSSSVLRFLVRSKLSSLCGLQLLLRARFVSL